eukprot:scaffold15741_cov168-Skeletonema_marinoi.AAC.8
MLKLKAAATDVVIARSPLNLRLIVVVVYQLSPFLMMLVLFYDDVDEQEQEEHKIRSGGTPRLG